MYRGYRTWETSKLLFSAANCLFWNNLLTDYVLAHFFQIFYTPAEICQITPLHLYLTKYLKTWQIWKVCKWKRTALLQRFSPKVCLPLGLSRLGWKNRTKVLQKRAKKVLNIARTQKSARSLEVVLGNSLNKFETFPFRFAGMFMFWPYLDHRWGRGGERKCHHDLSFLEIWLNAARLFAN